ncbi:helix-turn-helix domain-containing protein [candidate division WWE3 bacterium]|uniref:Helix-turn-helix domain-containing protein n=1 Tax=candidate division WWE3 bacterium TaxID=2053526 RepID=A0A955RRZ3_UNCKA|nr:helix-turn-helix domain-containing protein [candidate division WWE3 bacterium]
MKRVGDILQEERMRQSLSIEEISKLTKIREDFLQYIESGDYGNLPNEIYTRGFIQNYAQALGLDPKQVLPFYRREQKKIETGKQSKLPPQPLKKPRIYLTPSKIITAVVAFCLTAFVIILFIQYQRFADAPVLIIDTPPDNYVTQTENVKVVGKTDENASVTVNGEDVDVALNGEFTISYTLDLGVNRLRIVAVNQLGKKTVIERVVERKEEAP